MHMMYGLAVVCMGLILYYHKKHCLVCCAAHCLEKRQHQRRWRRHVIRAS